MFFPIRPISDRWPALVERVGDRFFWDDPGVIADDQATADQFRTAMSAVHIGGTMKITGDNRHPVADDLLLDNVQLSGATIVDIGASDGSTSMDLIRKLPEDFESYIIADLYLSLSVRASSGRQYFFDQRGDCVLVVGRRMIAWPAESGVVGALYARSIRRARENSATEVLLLNPEVRRRMAADPRVSYRTHDVFEPWGEPRPTVVKVANLLRRFYFSDERLSAALETILASLDEGAYFLIADNTREKGMPPRAGVYRKVGGTFSIVEESSPRPEIAGLIMRAGAEDLA